MSSFLNIRSSRPEVSCKKGVIKIKILQNFLKNIRCSVFDLIKSQAKGLQIYWKKTPAYLRFVERRQTATS